MRYEEYLAEEFRDPTVPAGVTRRGFLAGTSGAIVILLSLREAEEADAQGRGRGGRGGSAPQDWNTFLRIGADGKIQVFTGKIEMGQGVHTSLAMQAAEELNAPLDSIEMVMGDTERCPWDAGTFGSMTTRFFSPMLREACAEARGVLLDLGAEKLQCKPEELVCLDGKVCVKADRKRAVTFAALAQGQRIERHLTPKPQPEPPADYTVVGKPTHRMDAVAKVTGAAKYTGDVRLPGMLYARLVRPPAHGARFLRADTSAAKAMPGVTVVEEGDFIAVLAEHPDVAADALDKVKAEFEPPKSDLTHESIFDHLVKTAGEGRQAAAGGDLAAGERAAVQVFDETYTNAYVAHSPMEPHTACVRIEGNQATVWASTQRPFGIRDEVAGYLGSGYQVRLISSFVGGGFGGKSYIRQAVEAARLAKATGKPVMVAATREEEIFYDTFRPAAVLKIRSGIDGQGRITFWDYLVYNAGERGAPQFYDIPNHRTRGTSGNSPLATGAWRAPGNNSNSFAREVQIDIMAAKAGIDPIEFRLRNLAPDHPVRRCLQAAAKLFGYEPAKAPSGRGIGVACGTDVGTWVAHIAQVKVDKATGKVKVERVVCAQDMGRAINPEGARMQMEGCITMGLGYALAEEIRFKNGGDIENRNFPAYPVPRISALPKIETLLVGATENAPQGGGEPAIICMGAVIANAIHDAVGARVRHLPCDPAHVLAALKA